MENHLILGELLKQLPIVKSEFPLAGLNPLKLGGVADFYVQAKNSVEIATAVKAAIDLQLPYLVVGQAKGVLFSDGGFPGLVIHNMAESFHSTVERSQVVVDSGISLSKCVTWSVNQGLGGLVQFYGKSGTLGGALYSNLTVEGRSIFSLVRYITMVVPPTRMDREATIVRYKSDWLVKDENQTKLQFLREQKGAQAPQPIILTALLQLTSLRADELQSQLKIQSKLNSKFHPGFGPLFYDPPGTDVNHLLKGIEAHKLRIGNTQLDKHDLNYIIHKGGLGTASEIKQLVDEIKTQVRSTYATELQLQFEFVGVW